MKRKKDLQSKDYLRELGLKSAESEDLTLTSIRVPLEVDKLVSEMSKTEGVSKAEIYRRIVERGLKV